jgi:tetratricopeptide (TPR) repeat protein
MAWNRSFIWQDEVTLFVQSSEAGPKTPRVQDNAVAAIFELPHVRALFVLDKKQRALRVISGFPPEKREAIERTLAEAHRLFPEDEVVSSALGILCALSQHYQASLPFFEAAVQKSPQNPRYWVNLGQTYLELQTWSKAEEALSKALSLEPNQIDALRATSRLWWQQQNYPAALNALQKLKRLEPDQPEHDRWIQEAQTKIGLQLN